MKAKWKGKEIGQKPHTTIINQIKKQLSITNEGGISYKTETIFLFDALFGKVQHDFDLDHQFLYDSFERSIIDTFKKDKIENPDDILISFSKSCNKTQSNSYAVVTSLNLPKGYIPKNRSIEGCKLSFTTDIPKKYQSSRRKVIENNPELKLAEFNEYLFVTITTKALNVATAYLRAMRALDTIRALWQIDFAININFVGWPPTERYRANSIVYLGQVHTVHASNGSIASDGVHAGLWYDKKSKKRNLKRIKGLDRMDTNLGDRLKQLRNNPYKLHMVDCFQNYINALDHDDLEHKFFKLNTTLEKLLDAENTSLLVKRVSFFEEDRSLTKIHIENIRDARNISTHKGSTPANIELKIFQLNLYIRHIMRFFIANPFNYNNLSDVLSFISLPTQLTTIDDQIKKLNLVKEWIGKN